MKKDDASERLERQLAADAIKKMGRGETPTAREQGAVRRFEKKREEEKRREYYRTIPKKHWQELSGRQQKVINEQAIRYGLPIGGPVVDLFAAVRAFHDLIAANAHRLADKGGDDLTTRIKNTKLAQEELKLAQRRGELVNAAQAEAMMMMVFAAIGRGIEQAQQGVGAEPLRPLRESVEFARTQWERIMREGT